MAGILDILQQLLGGGGPQMARPSLYGQSPGGEGGPVVPRGPSFPDVEAAGMAPMGQQAPQVGGGGQNRLAGGGNEGGGGIFGVLRNLIDPQSQGREETFQYLKSQGLDDTRARIIAADPDTARQFLLREPETAKVNQYDEREAEGRERGLTGDALTQFTLAGKFGGDTDSKYGEREQVAKQYGLTEGTPEHQRFVLTGELPSNREQDPMFKNEMELGERYDSLPEVKDYKIVRSNYERIRKGVQLGTGAGDAAIVFGYMKMLDPTSVVREGEQASASNAAGVPEQIRGLYNRVSGGGNLSTEARRQIAEAASKVYEDAATNIGDLNTKYTGLATSWKLDPSRIISPTEQYDPLTVPDQEARDTRQPMRTRSGVTWSPN